MDGEDFIVVNKEPLEMTDTGSQLRCGTPYFAPAHTPTACHGPVGSLPEMMQMGRRSTAPSRLLDIKSAAVGVGDVPLPGLMSASS